MGQTPFLPVAADLQAWLHQNAKNFSGNDLERLLLAGKALCSCEAIALYWHTGREVTVPNINEPIESLENQLAQRLRHSFWPWLQSQPPRHLPYIQPLPDDLCAELSSPITLVALHDHTQRLDGMLVLAGEIVIAEPWQNTTVDPLIVLANSVRGELCGRLDPDTGLLHRAAFIQQVDRWFRHNQDSETDSSLLLIEFTSLLDIEILAGAQVAAMALNEYLGILETRLRARDVVGRLDRHTLAVLLKQCVGETGKKVANSLMSSLVDHQFQCSDSVVATQLTDTLLPINAEHKASEVFERLLPSYSQRASQDLLKDRSADPQTGLVLRFKAADIEEDSASLESLDGSDDRLEGLLAQPSLRVQPGVQLLDTAVVACYRLRVFGEQPSQKPLGAELGMLDEVLTQISANMTLQQRSLLPVLIVDLPGAFIDQARLEWLLTRCVETRVPMSTFCLAFSEQDVMQSLRDSLPVFKRANREGLRLKLNATGTGPYAYRLQQLLPLDYIEPSASLIQKAMSDEFSRALLVSQVMVAHSLNVKVFAANINSLSQLQFCATVGIDIGMGRQCGRSVPLHAIGFSSKTGG